MTYRPLPRVIPLLLAWPIAACCGCQVDQAGSSSVPSMLGWLLLNGFMSLGNILGGG